MILLLVPMLIQHAVIGRHYVNYEKKNKRALKFFFLFLAILVMFRHESVGNDTRNYIYFFHKISGLDWGDVAKYPLEIGYSYYNKAISLITDNPQVFLAITALVILAMIYPTYKRLCVDSALTIVLFCTIPIFVMMFSGIRQMMAIGIGFIAYGFVRQKKLIPFALCVFVGILFHTSAFMLVFMYPLYHLKITKRWLMVVVPVLTISFVFNRELFSILTIFIERYTEYDASVTLTGAYTMVVLFAAFAVFSFLIPDENCLDKETIGLRNFLLLSLALQMFAPLHTIAMRMNYYYIVFIPLLLPKIIECRNARWQQIAIVGRRIMIVFFLLYFFISANGAGKLHVFPYHFFWERF